MSSRPTELDLLAWIEGDLSHDRAPLVQRAMDSDPALAARLRAMRADRELLMELGHPALTRAPAGLIPAAIEAAERQAVLDDAPAVAGRIAPAARLAMAAGFFLVLAAGAAMMFSGALSSFAPPASRTVAAADPAGEAAIQPELAASAPAQPALRPEPVRAQESLARSELADRAEAFPDDPADTRPTLADVTRALGLRAADDAVGLSSLNAVRRGEPAIQQVGLTNLPLVVQPSGHTDGRAVRYAGAQRFLASWDPPAAPVQQQQHAEGAVTLSNAIHFAEAGRLVIRVKSHRPEVVNDALQTLVGMPGHTPACVEQKADVCRRTEVLIEADPACLQSLIFNLCRDGGPGSFAQLLVTDQDARSPAGQTLAARMRGSLLVVPVLIEPAD